MSFILDALRKSESERQQDTRPNIARIPDALPPRRLPGWALGTIAALFAGVVALGFAWWQTAREPSAPQTATRAVDAPGFAPVPIPPRDEASASKAAAGAPPTRAAEESVRIARTTLREAAAVDRGRAGSTASAAGNGRQASQGAAAALPAIEADLPRYAADGTLPALRLELHAYDDTPSGRFVFINGSKYVEGERLAEGPRLVAITTDGAVLLADGRQLLLRQE